MSATRSDRIRIARVACALWLAAFGVGCGGDGGSPMMPTPPGPEPASASALQLGSADASVPGQNTAGAVTLSIAAPAGGTVVTLSSSDAAAVVPASVTVPAGATTADVAVFTRAVSSNRVVTISASAGGETRTANLSLAAGTFLSFASPTGESIGLGRARRYEAADFGFTATIDVGLNLLSIDVRARGASDGWRLDLQAPPGDELRPGTYSNAVRYPSAGAQPKMSFGGFGRSCFTLTGSFQILDALYAAGPTVDRFHATFIQSCAGGLPLVGEIRITP